MRSQRRVTRPCLDAATKQLMRVGAGIADEYTIGEESDARGEGAERWRMFTRTYYNKFFFSVELRKDLPHLFQTAKFE